VNLRDRDCHNGYREVFGRFQMRDLIFAVARFEPDLLSALM
jgi:hypothetical protein